MIYSKIKCKIKEKCFPNFMTLQKDVVRLRSESVVFSNYLRGVRKSIDWNFDTFKCSVLNFISDMKVGTLAWQYGFCSTQKTPSIYNATYALMLKSLFLGPGAGLTPFERQGFVDYFLSLQHEGSGYFVDPCLEDGDYIKPTDENNVWWGYGHILGQVIICLQILQIKPQYPFFFLEKYYNETVFIDYLNSLNISDRVAYTGNILMNIGVALQYQGMICKDPKARATFRILLRWLREKCDPETGLLGKHDLADPHSLSQAIQCAYHYWPLFFYHDERPIFSEQTVRLLLKTQNRFGGYGINPFTSSACEDIDSVEPLVRMSPFMSSAVSGEIESSLRFALPWILANQNQDGGFVFQMETPLHYGHPSLSSSAAESNLFATWFRTLALAYLTKHLKMREEFYFVSSPGYCFL